MDGRPEPARIDPEGQANPARFGPAALLLIGVAVGLTVGLVAAVPLAGRAPPATGPFLTFDGLGTEVFDSTIPPLSSATLPASTTSTAPLKRLDELIPGFEGTLYLTGFTGTMKYLRWFHTLLEPTRLLPDEELTNIIVHPSGEQVAALTQLKGDRSMLWTGTPSGLAETALGNFGALTWHSTDQTRLAWVTFGSESRLKVLDLSSGAEIAEIETSLGMGGFVHLFDDQGFIIQSYAEEGDVLMVLDTDGRRIGSTDGYFVGMLGERIVVNDGNALFTADRLLGDRRSWVTPEAIWQISQAPLGQAFVTVGEVGATLWISDEVVLTLEGHFGLPAWSPDGRWVVMQVRQKPSLRRQTLQVIDATTLEIYELEVPVPLDWIDQIWFGP